MPYERIRLFDADTGESETFHVRISRRAFGEWLEDRHMLREAGRPDRPPDVDTGGLRAWVAHKDELAHPYFIAQAGMSSEGSHFPVMACSWRGEDTHARLYVIGFPDGGFVVKVTVEDRMHGDSYPAVEASFDADTPAAEVGDAIERLLESLGAVAGNVIPRLSTVEDFEAVVSEMRLAEAEMAQLGFFNPLPVGPVQ